MILGELQILDRSGDVAAEIELVSLSVTIHVGGPK
jgi:hypothetical protein